MTLDEERRCQVGLHNFVFFKNAQSQDQKLECLRCKTCNFFLLPSSVCPRTIHTHEDDGEPEPKKYDNNKGHMDHNGIINFDKTW